MYQILDHRVFRVDSMWFPHACPLRGIHLLKISYSWFSKIHGLLNESEGRRLSKDA